MRPLTDYSTGYTSTGGIVQLHQEVHGRTAFVQPNCAPTSVASTRNTNTGRGEPMAVSFNFLLGRRARYDKTKVESDINKLTY